LQKLRLAPLAILSLSIGLMTACDSTSSNNAPTISSPIVAKDASGNTIDAGSTLTTSTTGHLTGTVTDVASWIWVVKNASGTPVDTLVPSHAPAGSGDTKLGTGTDVLIAFTPTAKWGPTGAYTIVGTLTGTSGGTTTTPAITFNAVPGGSNGTPLATSTQLSVGGFSATPPSFIGLSPIKTYPSSQTSANVGSIDLVFDANTDGSGEVLESPYYGYNTSGSLTSNYWSSGRTTLIAAVSTAPTTLEAAKAVSLSSQTVAVTSTGIYVAKTQDNVYAVIKISNLSGTGDAATATVTVLEQ
jgi:hypothetical protein